MNRVDRKVALPHLIIYSDDRLLLVSSWHLTHACPHFFVYYDKCVWDSGVYSDLYNLLSVGTCIWPSLFSSYWLDSLMSNALASVDLLWHDHCEPLHYFHKQSPCWCILWLHAWYGVDIISSSSLFFLGRCHCMQMPVRMQHHRLHHAFPWCMPCMVHCTSTPCIYIYLHIVIIL